MKSDTTPPRNGALSGCETVPDADSRVLETYPPVCHVPSQKNLTLTDTERQAIATAMNAYGENNDDAECAQIEQTLWKLLERTK